MKYLPHNFLQLVAAIVATGALLNLAGRGTFGDTVKGLANYVTTGYGAPTSQQ